MTPKIFYMLLITILIAITIKKNKKVNFCYGIDISRFQGDELASSTFKNIDSLKFVICKATEGITYTDPKFTSNWKTLKNENIIRGAYHFYYTKDDPIQQANHFLNTLTSLSELDLPPILDFEDTSIDSKDDIAKIQRNMLLFLKTIEGKTNRTPILYTNNSTANTYLNDSQFAKYPLWIADYKSITTPKLPEIWKNKGWSFWQKSSEYKIGSITNDLDVFNGNLQALKKFIKQH
jgi:lysozyme